MIAQPQRASGPELAQRVAALARKVEAVRRAPRDIEWAVEGDRLWLLQARPITALPVAPEIEAPKGSWQKDAAHFPEPLSPFAVSVTLTRADQFFDDAYLHVEPDDGGKAPPPWWLLGLVARIVPSMRGKLRAAARAVGAGKLDPVPAEWVSHHRPRLRRESSGTRLWTSSPWTTPVVHAPEYERLD